MTVNVKYDDLYKALEPLRGLRLKGSVQGPPTSKFPLRVVVDALAGRIVSRDSYRESEVVCAALNDKLYLVCHFGLDSPDDFCVAVEGGGVCSRLGEAAQRLSKLTGESYTLTLAALVHALQGIVSGEGEEVEVIEDPDQVIEELLTWLPEYVAVTD